MVLFPLVKILKNSEMFIRKRRIKVGFGIQKQVYDNVNIFMS